MGSLLICDLDGTLVDSFPGIAAALRQACESVGVAPVVPITRSLVGPPLDELLRTVAGAVDDAVLDRLRERFVASYDGGACRLAVPFAGVAEMLATVRSRGHTLALATNKRLAPTREILDSLSWRQLFVAIETVDSRPGTKRDKTAMLVDIRRESPGAAAVVYLGDTAEDVRAAAEAGMPCILATWGYDATGAGAAAATMAATPRDITPLLEAVAGASAFSA